MSAVRCTGDRHLANQLVDQQTGEVIHIDFGMVFEQGKVRLSGIRDHRVSVFPI